MSSTFFSCPEFLFQVADDLADTFFDFRKPVFPSFLVFLALIPLFIELFLPFLQFFFLNLQLFIKGLNIALKLLLFL